MLKTKPSVSNIWKHTLKVCKNTLKSWRRKITRRISKLLRSKWIMLSCLCLIPVLCGLPSTLSPTFGARLWSKTSISPTSNRFMPLWRLSKWHGRKSNRPKTMRKCTNWPMRWLTVSGNSWKNTMKWAMLSQKRRRPLTTARKSLRTKVRA